MAENRPRLQHFQFSDPISKEAASRTTRYRLLKKRRRDSEVEEITILNEEIEEAENEIVNDEVGDNTTFVSPHFNIASENEQFGVTACSYIGEDVEEDVDLPADPEVAITCSDDSESDESSDETSIATEEESVFQGCPLSKSSSNLLVLKYKIRHNLTLQATSDLLDLLQLHCPSPNSIPSSLHCFNMQFPTLCYKTTLHYFCSSCLQLVPNKQTSTCPNTSCGKSLRAFRALSSFIELSLDDQIKNLMERK